MDKIVTKQKVYGLKGHDDCGVDYCAKGDKGEEGCEVSTYK
jgi:hypothetical protein